MSAVAISAYGFIHIEGNQFVGDCETTTDVLGPFYRPGSPVRTNLMISNEMGDRVELSGFIKHKDCTTPYKNAKVELWHCDVKGVYDNSSDEFRYRGTTFSNDQGFYSFQTVFPVAYAAGPDVTRPAHFHLMITAPGYQPLITQLYFNGDAHINADPYASSPNAKRRILDVQKKKSGITKVSFDVGMAEVLEMETATIDRLTGTYVDVANNKNVLELFKFENRLWARNEAFGNKFEYAGNNTFQEPNNPQNMFWKLEFEFLASGGIQLKESYASLDLSKKVNSYLKEK